LINIVWGNPGTVDPAVVESMLRQNGINAEDFKHELKKKAALLTLTENYL